MDFTGAITQAVKQVLSHSSFAASSVPASGVTGTLGPGHGGTGLATFAVGDIIYASGTGTLARLADVATGQFLKSGGTNTAPAYGTIGTSDLPTVPVTKGGTNLTSFVAGDVIFASGANTLAKLAKGTDGQVLTLAAGLPSWANAAGGAAIDPTTSKITLGQGLGAVPQLTFPTDQNGVISLPAAKSLVLAANVSSVVPMGGNFANLAATFAVGVPFTYTQARGNLGLVDTTAGTAAGLGGGIMFGTGNSSINYWHAGIRGFKEGAGAGAAASLVFSTTNNSLTACTDYMALTTAGHLQLAAGSVLGWTSTAGDPKPPLSLITGVSQISAGVVALGTGAFNAVDGTLSLRSVVLNGSTSGAITLSPGATPTSRTITLPATDGTNGQVLITNGSNVLSFATISGGEGGPLTVAAKTADYVVQASESGTVFTITGTTAPVKFTLPALQSGLTYTFIESMGAYNLQIDAAGGASTIYNFTSDLGVPTLYGTGWGSITFVCDGSRWYSTARLGSWNASLG